VGADVIVGDVTRPDTLPAAVAGIDAVVFTLGSDGAGKVGAENVDYGGVRNVLNALGSRPARVALMTSIGVTNRTGAYNRSTEAHDWKRRAERLVRASRMPYTIVRPGWFDYNGPDEHRLVLLQGCSRLATAVVVVSGCAMTSPRTSSRRGGTESPAIRVASLIKCL
jgi:uncharacterized protein YbjT (DUF2867 family)